MFATFRALLFSAVVCLGMVGLGSPASAERVVFEQIPLGGTPDIDHAIPGGVLVTVEISAQKVITAVAQRAKFSSANSVIFVVREWDAGGWTKIVETDPQAQAAATDFAYVRSPDFPPVTLEPGKTYAIGMLVKNANFGFERPAYLPLAPVDGVKVTSGLVYHDDAGASLKTTSGLAYSLKLIGPDPAAVPTLSEWSLILMGLMMAGGAAVWLQRRRTA